MYMYGIQDLRSGKTSTAFIWKNVAEQTLRNQGLQQMGELWQRDDGAMFRIQRILVVTRRPNSPLAGQPGHKKERKSKRKVYKTLSK